MFIGLDQDGRTINLLERKGARGGSYLCPACQRKLVYKAGSEKRAHFAHYRRTDCVYFNENESEEHLELKASFYRWAKESSQVEVEAYVESSQQIADLLLEKKLVLEVQCSSLSIERLRERNQLYRSAGLSTIWLLGHHLFLKEGLSKLQREFLEFSPSLGFFLWQAHLKEACLELIYFIHEDHKGQLYYKSKIFPFYAMDLWDCLRYPYSSRELVTMEVAQDPDFLSYLRKQLYYKNPRWMKKQEALYLKGRNLLSMTLEDFYPQVLPAATSCQGGLSYRKDFYFYYKVSTPSSLQVLYSPFFYSLFRKGLH